MQRNGRITNTIDSLYNPDGSLFSLSGEQRARNWQKHQRIIESPVVEISPCRSSRRTLGIGRIMGITLKSLVPSSRLYVCALTAAMKRMRNEAICSATELARIRNCCNPEIGRTIRRTFCDLQMRVFVGVKRALDYAAKVRVAGDKSGA